MKSSIRNILLLMAFGTLSACSEDVYKRQQFGPEVNPSDAAGTSQNMGSGYTNTQNIVKKFNALQLSLIHICISCRSTRCLVGFHL